MSYVIIICVILIIVGLGVLYYYNKGSECMCGATHSSKSEHMASKNFSTNKQVHNNAKKEHLAPNLARYLGLPEDSSMI
jgi:hypothetical protein